MMIAKLIFFKCLMLINAYVKFNEELPQLNQNTCTGSTDTNGNIFSFIILK